MIGLPPRPPNSGSGGGSSGYNKYNTFPGKRGRNRPRPPIPLRKAGSSSRILTTGEVDEDGDVVPPPPPGRPPANVRRIPPLNNMGSHSHSHYRPRPRPRPPLPRAPSSGTATANSSRQQGRKADLIVHEPDETIPPPPSYPRAKMMPYQTIGTRSSPSSRSAQRKHRSHSIDSFETSSSSKFKGYNADSEHSMSSSGGDSTTSVEMSRATSRTSLSDMSSILGATTPSTSERKHDPSRTPERTARKSFLTFDKYGFPHKTEVNDPIKKREIIRRDNLRLDKWRDMMFSDAESRKLTGVSDLPQQVQHWNKVKKHKKLKSRVRKGVPDPLRRDVWQNMCGSRELMAKQPYRYREILNSGEPSEEEEQIQKDLNRTYRDHKDFQDADGALMRSLFNVLRVYSLYDKELGYCQGMSGVAALNLMYMSEEESFWVLVALAGSDRYQMRDCWIQGMPLVHQKFFQFTRLLKHFMPKLYRHFQKEGVTNPSMYGGTAWFVDVFLSNQPPFEMVVRIWDVFLHEGQKFVFRIALAVLQKNEKALLKLDFADILLTLNDAFRNLDADEMIPLATNIKLTHKMLNKLEKQYKKLPKDVLLPF